jgi:hypothetical protein
MESRKRGVLANGTNKKKPVKEEDLNRQKGS